MSNEINYLDNVKEYYDFNSIAQIVKIMYKVKDKNNASFSLNGKKYQVKRKDDKLDIKCNDGRKLRVGYKFEEYCPDYSDYNCEDELGVTIRILYQIFEDSALEIECWCGPLINEDSFIDQLNGEKLKCMIKNIYYISKNNVRFVSFTDNKIDDKNFDFCLNINSDGIKTKDGDLISLDCERLLFDCAAGHNVPSKEEVINFDIEKVKEKFNKAINNSGLSEFIKDELIRTNNFGYVVDYYAGLSYSYNETLPTFKSAMNFRKVLMENRVKEYLFSNEELTTIVQKLKEAFDYSELAEARKKLESKVNNIYESLSPQEIDILRKKLEIN